MTPATYILETDASVAVGPISCRQGKEREVVAGGGVVLRDPDLRLLAARSVPLGPISSPTAAELAAIIAGIEVALEFRVRDLRVWNDNLSLVQHLKSEGGTEVFGCEGLLARLCELGRQFERLEFRWARGSHAPERRAGEPTADYLARRAIGLGSRSVPRHRGRG